MVSFDTSTFPQPISDRVYLVGGSVRDLLLNREPADYDIAVLDDAPAYAGQLARSTNGHLVALGQSGQMIYRVVSATRIYDVSAVEGHSIEEDLHRRDFCINAIAYQLSSKRLIDPISGRQDLQNRQIRMVSRGVFDKDPVRLIRAYRLAAELKFAIQPDTAAAIAEDCALISASPGERVWAELSRLLNCDSAQALVVHMAQSGLLESMIPEFRELKGFRQGSHHRLDAFDHSLSALGFLEESLNQSRSRPTGSTPLGVGLARSDRQGMGPLKLALLLHDVAKPVTRQIGPDGNPHFYGHATVGARMAAAICDRLRMANRTSGYIRFVIQNHLHPLALYTARQQDALSRRALTRFFVKCRQAVPDILLHAWADMQAKGTADSKAIDDFKHFLTELTGQFDSFVKSKQADPMLVNGQDLIDRLGLAPGPLFARILKAVHTAQLAGELKTRAEALNWVTEWLAKRGLLPDKDDNG